MRKILELLGKIVLILGGIAGFTATVLTIVNSMAEPRLTVANRLSLPVMVYVNDNPAYTVRVSPNSTVDINLFSNSEFPAAVKWEAIRDVDKQGRPLGESLASSLPKVDKGRKVTINNLVNGNYYFFPVLENNTNQSCEIRINEGLGSQEFPGILNAQQHNIAPGYYKWTKNSNVTLMCAGHPYWWGTRYGTQGGTLSPQSGSGALPLGIP